MDLRCAGLYYYSARLAPRAYKGLAGFMTASCNILGVVTSLPYIIMQVAQLLATIRYALTYDTMTGGCARVWCRVTLRVVIITKSACRCSAQ